VKAEKRGKKSLQYIDLANAVARLDNLEFLTDVIPRTTTYRKFTQERGKNFKPSTAAPASTDETNGMGNGVDVNGHGSPSTSRQHLSLQALGIDEEQPPSREAGDDVVMRDGYGSQAVLHDPIQEQLAMEMDNEVNGNYGLR